MSVQMKTFIRNIHPDTYSQLHCSTLKKGVVLPAKIKDKNLLRNRRIEIRLNKHELETITDKAKSRGLNKSAYLRNISINYPVKSIVDPKAKTALLKSNGDLAKLGGLFKMWLDESEDDQETFINQLGYKNIDALVDEIEAQLKVIHADAIRLGISIK